MRPTISNFGTAKDADESTALEFVANRRLLVEMVNEHAGALDAGASPPWVDLRSAPYNVVAGDATKKAQNTAGIKAAIATYSGTKAKLVLPSGTIYCGRDGTGSAITFGTNVTDLVLTGQGMYATMLVFDDTSFGGDWHGILCDGCQRIEICNLGVKQINDLGADGQQHHLIRTAVTGAGGVTRDIFYHHLFFGSGGQLCDAFQIFGNTGTCVNIRLLHFHMSLGGIGLGSRSGMAIQRGYSCLEIGYGYVIGCKNSQFDMESTGSATIEYPFIHDLVLDNSQSQTSNAMSLSGVDNGANVKHARVRDVTIINGRLSISDTDDCHVLRLNIIATTPWPADVNLASVQVFQDNNDLVLEDISLERTGTAGVGRLLDIQNTGIGTTIKGGLFVQGTADYPIYVDGAANLKVQNVRIEYSGSSASKAGIFVSAVARSSDDLQIDGVDLINTGGGGNLRSVVDIDPRTGMSMNRIRVVNINGNNSVTNGVYLSFGTGSTMDKTPFLASINGWVTAPWKQVDESDNIITTLFPCVSGNPGSAGAKYIGDVTPAGNLAAPQGSFCIWRNGDSTQFLFKATNTTTAGWTQITVP
jgi:hypothetical protein